MQTRQQQSPQHLQPLVGKPRKEPNRRKALVIQDCAAILSTALSVVVAIVLTYVYHHTSTPANARTWWCTRIIHVMPENHYVYATCPTGVAHYSLISMPVIMAWSQAVWRLVRLGVHFCQDTCGCSPVITSNDDSAMSVINTYTASFALPPIIYAAGVVCFREMIGIVIVQISVALTWYLIRPTQHDTLVPTPKKPQYMPAIYVYITICLSAHMLKYVLYYATFNRVSRPLIIFLVVDVLLALVRLFTRVHEAFSDMRQHDVSRFMGYVHVYVTLIAATLSAYPPGETLALLPEVAAVCAL